MAAPSGVENDATLGEKAENTSPASSPHSPEPSRPIYEQQSDSRHIHSTSSKSRTLLPPDTPAEQRESLEQLKKSIVFDEADKDEPSKAEGKEEEENVDISWPSEETEGESGGTPAPLSVRQSPVKGVGEDKEEEEKTEEGNGDDGNEEAAEEDLESEKQGILEMVQAKLHQVGELLKKATGLRQSMVAMKNQGEEFDDEQFAKVDMMCQKLVEEKNSYEIMLSRLLMGDDKGNEDASSESPISEEEARQLAALREQKEVFSRLLQQQRKLRDLEQKQAVLVAMQRAAQSELKVAEQRRTDLLAHKKLEGGKDGEESGPTERYREVTSDNKVMRTRLHELEAKQSYLEHILQHLTEGETEEGEVTASVRLQQRVMAQQAVNPPEQPPDQSGATQQQIRQLGETSVRLGHLRGLLEKMEEVQGEAQEASSAALLNDERKPRRDEEVQDNEEEDDQDVESLDWLLASGIDDPELKEQLRQLQERKKKIKELRQELNQREQEREEEEESEGEEQDNEEDDYTEMADWTEKQYLDVRLQKLVQAKAKIEELQALARQVQSASEQVRLAEQRRQSQEGGRSEGEGSAGESGGVIDLDELVGLGKMVEDYGDKLTDKKKELDRLVLEHRALSEAEDAIGKLDLGEESQESDHRLTKGEMASNTLLWTEMQKQEQLMKQLKQKKKEVAMLQEMASEQEEALQYARTRSAALPMKRTNTGRASADVTLATWGGSTQQSLESFPAHSLDQSDSESLTGDSRKKPPSSANKRRSRRRPPDLNALPSKKKKHTFDSEFNPLKEESETSTTPTHFFGASSGLSAIWPGVIFPQKKKEPTAPAKPPNTPSQAAGNRPEVNQQQEANAQRIHQQLLHSTASCNSLLREQLALLQLIQEGGGNGQEQWRVQEYVRRFHDSCHKYSHQQRQVMHVQQELSQLYGEKLAASMPPPPPPPPPQMNATPPSLPSYSHPFGFPSPYLPPWHHHNPYYPPYSPWTSAPYPGASYYPSYGASPYSQPDPTYFPWGRDVQSELPSTTQAVYPAAGAETNEEEEEEEDDDNGGDDDVSQRTYSISGSHPRVDHLVVSEKAPGTGAGVSVRKNMAAASRAKENDIAGLLETLSLSSAQSSVPGGGDELGDDAGDFPLFEALRDVIYSEVAALISQNESRPHFLIELFRELQLLSSDYLKQRALYAIQDLVTKYLTEDSAQAVSAAKVPDSYFQGWGPSSSEQDSQDEGGMSEEQAAKYRKKYNEALSLAAARALSPNAYDYTEPVDSASSLATPDENPFAKDSLGETMIQYKQPKEKPFVSAQLQMTEDDGESNVSDLEIDTQALDQQVKSIIHEVIPVLKDHMDEVCSPQLLSYIQALVLTLAKDKDDGEGFARSYNSQLAATIQGALEKFTGRKMSECGEDLVVEISEILFNELAFLKLMQEMGRNPAATLTPKTSVQIQDGDSESESSVPGHISQKEEDPTNDDFTFSGGEDGAKSRSPDGVLTSGQLDSEQEQLGKTRDDAMAQQCEFPRSEDKGQEVVVNGEVQKEGEETLQEATSDQKNVGEVSRQEEPPAALVEIAARKAEEIRDAVEEEQISLKGINVVIKEVETQPELVGGDEPPKPDAAAAEAE